MAIAAAALSAGAVPTDTHASRGALIDSIRTSMARLTTPADSIAPLFNIYDLTYRPGDRSAVLHKVIGVANRSGNVEQAYDAITHLANIWWNRPDSLQSLKRMLADYPPSDRRNEARLFVDLLMVENEIKNNGDSIDEAEQHRLLSESLRKFNAATPDNPYERVKMLYALCLQLGNATRGELLLQYARKLEDLVESMPLTMGTVRNLIYTRTAQLYSDTGRWRRAMETDKKMLNIIDSLRTNYEANGRPFRNMAVNRYNCYRRLLSSYKALSPYEIEQYYRGALALAQQVDVINADFYNNERPSIYYNMAKGNYPEAIAAIKRQIDKPNHAKYRDYFLRALVEAAEATGDVKTQLESALELNQSLLKQLDNRSDDSYRELQLRYDVESLKADIQAKKEAREAEYRRSNRLFFAGLTLALIGLIILSLLLARQNRRVKRTTVELKATADSLRADRNQLRDTQQALVEATDRAQRNVNIKTEFIHNMCHEVQAPLTAISEYSQLIVDCIPAEQKRYLDRIAYNLDKNIKLILTLVNDVVDMASLEHGGTAITREPVSVKAICNLAMSNIFDSGAYPNENVEVVFNPANKDDIQAETDFQRVVQILMNFLSNAAKFTERGKITIDYADHGDTFEISVADTGIGIPEELEEKVFERFYQIDPKSQGSGLGLYITRLIAGLLGGTVTLEHVRRGGTRFIVTLPKK